MSDRKTGTLVVIGGHEDKNDERTILRAVAKRLRGKLVLATVASHQPAGYFEAYQKAFADLGVEELVELYVDSRAEAFDPEKIRLLDGAGGVFFSGGDQLRISSQVGGTPIEERVREIYRSGGVLAGTSAGASIMGEIMMVSGASAETHRIGDLRMAPGMGLVAKMIIDQHFAERGRIGRLLGAVAHNPTFLGVGVDEDTAMVIERTTAEIIGSGGVYVVDASRATRSNIAEGDKATALSIHGVAMTVLAAGDAFDLATRRPVDASA